jgi:uncharacterized protein
MQIKDKVYGDFEITEPVLIELINSPTLQRLKGVSQQGMPRAFYHREVFSRFEHSIGVFLLLRKLGANLYEQIAGLLHDISHTAFSHVIDWVIGDPSKEDHQDNIFLEILEKSEIPKILSEHGIDIEKISDLESFTLLETEAPSLCADRIDYSLRELIDLGYLQEVKNIVNNFSTKNGQIVFIEKEIAEDFARKYAMLQREHWAGNEAKARYHILAEILKIALEEKYLNLEDFHKTDDEILDILSKTEREEILEGLQKLKDGFNILESNDEKSISLKKKFRYIDPEVLIGNEIKRLSALSESYNKFITNEIEDSKKIISIKIQ